MIYACGKGMRPIYVHKTAEGVDEFCKMQKPDWCPLGNIPTPHGILVDADDVKTTIKNLGSYFDEYLIALLFNEIDKHVPTVIEAEE
jgi:hypothetical protein